MNLLGAGCAVYGAVFVIFVLAFCTEGIDAQPVDRRTVAIVVAAGLLWPIAILAAIVCVFLDKRKAP